MHLATRLLQDGFNGQYEQAVDVSNDAGSASVVRRVRDGLDWRVCKWIRTPGAQAPAPHWTRLPTLGASGSAT